MASLNKMTLIGHLGADPVKRMTPNGTETSQLSVATTDKWKDKKTGEPQELTEWHRVVFYGRLAEVVNEYLKKGAQIFVEGSLRTREWKDKQDVTRYTTEIRATELKMLDKKPSADKVEPAQSAQAAAKRPPANLEMDDDIPF